MILSLRVWLFAGLFHEDASYKATESKSRQPDKAFWASATINIRKFRMPPCNLKTGQYKPKAESKPGVFNDGGAGAVALALPEYGAAIKQDNAKGPRTVCGLSDTGEVT